ncbi:MAG: hydroxyisourate hydrolase [Myxococcota bacterium]
MSAITTHVLDTARGRPAAGVPISLQRRPSDDSDGDGGDTWVTVGSGVTDGDGRLRTLVAADTQLEPGTYRITFDTAAYFADHGIESFYPLVRVVFAVRAADEHYHVPLLLSPYGYSTYRGS